MRLLETCTPNYFGSLMPSVPRKSQRQQMRVTRVLLECILAMNKEIAN
jgi:hypothetical protein